MNPIHFFRKSIQNKIFISFLIVLIIPISAISISNYLVSVNLVKEKVSNTFHDNLLYIGNSIEMELSGIEKLTDLLYIDPNIQQALSISHKTDLEYFEQLQKVDQIIHNLSNYSTYYRYITSLFIFGNNGSQYIYGRDAYAVDTEQLLRSEWSKQTHELGGKVLWMGVHENENKSGITPFKYVFSLSRSIKNTSYNRNVGSLYVSFNTNVFTEILSKASPYTRSQLYIADQNGQIVFPHEKLSRSLEAEGIKLPKSINQSNFEIENNGTTYMVSNYYIDKYGWNIIQMVPLEDLTKDSNMIFTVSSYVFCLSLIFSAALWYFVAAGIVRPIKKLILTMKNVKGSNLLVKSSIDNIDEVGLLSVNYNYMIERIHALFAQVLEEEAKKRHAEIKALQGQITPHFLYNTLNTIRWMAIIQKSDGIKEVVDALGRLLKNTYKKDNSFIPLYEELQMIRDYIYIQQTRYRDKFQVNYDVDQDLLTLKCVKFILQPIVENAIFHGIEPQERPGVIQITAASEGATLHVTVEDNGVGIAPSQIEGMLLNSSPDNLDSRGIGIQNVNQRIKMICGDTFGIRIESEPGEYTRVHILLPLEAHED